MKSNALKPEQMWMIDDLKRVATQKGNISLAMGPSHLAPYREMTQKYVKEFETSARESFLSALQEEETYVVVRAVPEVRHHLNFDSARVERSRGNVIRLTTTHKKWFEDNWNFFAADLGVDRVGTRSVYVYMKYDEASLARLVRPWWNPNVHTNPSIAHSMGLMRDAKTRVQPEVVVFSLAFPQLWSCELFYHPDDLDAMAVCICENARKDDWWGKRHKD